jgi:hypothetical protein
VIEPVHGNRETGEIATLQTIEPPAARENIEGFAAEI